jgi:hypothetical protein
MTGIDRRGDTPMGPPWPVDVLADLHAGVLDAAVADDLWPQVLADPDAAAVLDALDATIAELGGLSAAPTPQMPAYLAARLDMAMAEEARAAFPAPRFAPPPAQWAPQRSPMTQSPVVDLAQARARRNRRIGWATGVLVAAAAAAAAVVVVAIPRGEPGIGEAAPPPTSQAPGDEGAAAPVQLNSTTLHDSAVALSAMGRTDYGPQLSAPSALMACLSANGVQGSPIGGMQVVYNGQPGTLLVLTTGQLARYRVLVVGQNCSATTPDLLAAITVGEPSPPTH